jgi:hypothetical protein
MAEEKLNRIPFGPTTTQKGNRMKKTLVSVAIATMALSLGVAAQAQHRHDRPPPPPPPPSHHDHHGPQPQDHRWHGGSGARNWDAAAYYQQPTRYQRERRMSRNDEIYRGNDGRYYCRRSDGTTGLVVGGVLGGLLGNSIGGDSLSTLLGVAGGAALGNAIDRGQVRCR